MSWKHEYLDRAQAIAVKRRSMENKDLIALEDMQEYIDLEDDVQGKLAIWQCVDLLDWLYEMPYTQASIILTSMIPLDVADYTSE